MPFTIDRHDHDPSPLATLRNLTEDPDLEAPLGRLYAQTGNGHFVGLDDTYQPVVMRAYWDVQTQGLRSAGEFVGYMQFVEVSYAGTPISPEVFGGQLAGRGVYESARHRFIDFMGPGDVLARWDEALPISPHYAWNTALTMPITRWQDLVGFHPAANGAFFTRIAVTAPNKVLGPVIAAEVPSGLFTEAALLRLLGDAPDRTFAVSPAQAAVRPFYEYALEALRSPGEWLDGLDNSQLGARAVGSHVLIDVPDDEDLGPTLCMRMNDPAQRVELWLLRYHELQSAESAAVAEAMLRMSREASAAALAVDSMLVEPPVGRGTGGLELPVAPPPPEPVVFRFHTWVIGSGTGNRLVPESGIAWSVTMAYDSDARDLQLASLGPATALAGFDHGPELDAYGAAIARARQLPPAQRPSIDMTNFLLADVRRSKFGGWPRLTVPQAT